MSISPLFRGLFDDAALFPPGNAELPAAVAGHAGYQQAWYAELVGWFVCPAARLAELAAEQATQGAPPLDLALTVPGGPAELGDAILLAGELAGLRLRAVEVPVAVAELAGWIDRLQAASDGLRLYVEVPIRELTGELASALSAAGLGLKLRTGGTVPEAFPSADELAEAIAAAVAAGVGFKCTAGLHNAVAHLDPATGFAHHGFLNVLLAVHAAIQGQPAAAVLAVREPAELAELAAGLSEQDVSAVRAGFGSIGSCSITDPLADLENLKLVLPS